MNEPDAELGYAAPSGGRKPRNWGLSVFLLCLIAAAGAAGYYFYYVAPSGEPQAVQHKQRPGGRKGFDPNRPMPVVAVPAKSADVPVILAGLGTVTPLATVTVRSRIDGQLMRTLFTEGQIVKAGDLLAEIDPRTWEAQLAQAEGQMARDQALLRNARLDLERYRTLFQQDSIARQQLDTQESLVRQYEATAKVDQAAIDTAKLQLYYCRITAPISGRLGLRLVDPGNIVRAGDASGIVVITQLEPISVVFTMPEDNVPGVMAKLRAREKLPVEAWDRAEKTRLATGTLLTVDNQIDSTTGTLKLKAQFSNKDFSLFPNQFVNTRMQLEMKQGATVIPSAAVQRGSQGTFVYVVKEDSTVTIRQVSLGPVQGENIAIEKGLAPGEIVVTDGADKLRQGGKVDVGGRNAAAGKDGRKGGRGEGSKREGGKREDGKLEDGKSEFGKGESGRGESGRGESGRGESAKGESGKDQSAKGELRKGGWRKGADAGAPSPQ
ncbi:MAG: MdtA/MuxA family multidrug efflux RND transporter periplasmic adaptor subunit [Betaproteobacteria bacterium]|nr:MdtA/MuxA family multidrug efflux RND transporter periplasmic adaptor subunit [Betaproteobacteria bacterium]